MKRILLAVLCCGLFISVVVAQGKTPKDSSTSDLGISIKTRQSNTAVIPIAARVGDEFAVTLESNATTGYKWQLTEKPKSKIATLVSSVYNPPVQQIPGRGGSETYTFKAIGKGTTTITLAYARSWERNVAPVKVQKFKITVQ